jgi:DNA-binding transcriptional regulator YhcF (GntR family)
MILRVDAGSPVPPYEQVRAQITALVAAGVLGTGTRLPSIRQLAHDLGLAGGTIARAYRELETTGIVATRGRHGTVVVAPATATAVVGSDAPRSRRLARAAAAFATEASGLGAGVEEAVGALRAAFTVQPAAGGEQW